MTNTTPLEQKIEEEAEEHLHDAHPDTRDIVKKAFIASLHRIATHAREERDREILAMLPEKDTGFNLCLERVYRALGLSKDPTNTPNV